MFKFRQMPWHVRIGYILEQISVTALLIMLILGWSISTFLGLAIVNLMGSRVVTDWRIERLEQHINELEGKIQ